MFLVNSHYCTVENKKILIIGNYTRAVSNYEKDMF